jgi:hypothetical protein
LEHQDKKTRTTSHNEGQGAVTDRFLLGILTYDERTALLQFEALPAMSILLADWNYREEVFDALLRIMGPYQGFSGGQSQETVVSLIRRLEPIGNVRSSGGAEHDCAAGLSPGKTRPQFHELYV